MDLVGFTSLKKIALKSIHSNRWQNSEYKLIISLLIRAMRDLNLFTIKGSRSVRLTMNDINCIDIPQDYLSFISLAVPYNGRMWTMTQDNLIVSPMTKVNGVLTLDSTKGEGVSQADNLNSVSYPDFYYDGFSGLPPITFETQAYNMKGGINQFYYKIEPENGRIVIDGIRKSEVTLTYKTSGVSSDGATLVPVISEEALLSFVNWKMAESQRIMNWSEYFEQEYQRECNKIKFLQAPTLDVLYDTMFATFKQGTKR